VMKTEQLNIEGKRSGEGFVAHKANLVNALSRALAERVMLLDFSIGRKGFLSYLKSLGGSNVVKVVPSSNGNASASRVADKRLKVVCGSNTSYLEDSAWIGDKTPLTICEVRVTPKTRVQPNLGAIELSEALSRVLPFTTKEDSKPVLRCVLFRVKDGKLTLVSADGFRLAMVKLDFDGDEGEVLVNRDDLRGIASALRRARRVRLGLEKNGENPVSSTGLVLETELIRYRWRGADGHFPDYERLIPADFSTLVSFDTNEAIRAASSLRVLSESKAYPIDLAIGNGKMVMSSPDEKGQTEIAAETQGEGRIRLSGSYLADALRACGGMVELKLVNSSSPMVFAVDGFELVTMPMYSPTSQKPSEDRPAEPVKAETSQPTEPEAATPTAEPVAEAEAEKAQAIAEAEAITQVEKPKRKRSKPREPVAIA
jgi:DNA polymerase-3 subunit beta